MRVTGSLLSQGNNRRKGGVLSLQDVAMCGMVLGSPGAKCPLPEAEAMIKSGRAEGWGPGLHRWTAESALPVAHPISGLPVTWENTLPSSKSQVGFLMVAAERILSS